MARPDTAGFYYYGPFYGHSKTQIVPGGDDTGPVDNPTTPRDPCDNCPPGYTCVNGECVAPIGTKADPEALDNPTVDTQCRLFTSRGSGIKTTASGVFSGYDANSGGQWTFKCAGKLTFYGRINASASSGLVNDIRWGVGNHVRSFIVPEGSIDEQSIFRFTESVDGKYKIEIKRKNVGSTYYDWQIYEQGKLEEADGETLYVGVSALAELWYVTSYEPTQETVLFRTDYGEIVRHNDEKLIYITKYQGDEIVICDRDIGADNFGEGGKIFLWGGVYPLPAYPGDFDTEDWSSNKGRGCSVITSYGYGGFDVYIPSKSDWDRLAQLCVAIKGDTTPEWEILDYLRLTMGGKYYSSDGSEVYDNITPGYWTSDKYDIDRGLAVEEGYEYFQGVALGRNEMYPIRLFLNT